MGKRAEIAGAAGFTLLELIVTLFLMGLAAAVVGPAIGRGVETVQARADVAGFLAMFRHAREQAITTQHAFSVVVDPIGHRVTLLTEEEVRSVRALPARVTVEADPPPALTVKFEPQGLSTGGDFRFTSGTVQYRVTIDAITGRVRSARR
jgi:general secretion pathway protein H